MLPRHFFSCTISSCRDETTVLAFNGLGKVMRAHMPTVLALPGINDKWDEVCRIASQALMSGRKSVAVSAAQLLTGFLQVCAGMDGDSALLWFPAKRRGVDAGYRELVAA
jgi:hypothetical protein